MAVAVPQTPQTPQTPKTVCPACGLTNQGTMTRCLRCDAPLATAIARQCMMCSRLNIGIQQSCLFCRTMLPPAYVPARAQPLPTCPACHNPLKPGKSFCTSCGHQLSAAAAPITGRHCTRCGKAVPVGKNFCTGCGHPMS